MADIEKPIVYDVAIKKRILDFLDKSDLKSSDWSGDEIKDIRKLIRDYYRDLKGICVYCRKDISLRSASNCHIEHIIPKGKYLQFMFEPKNLCVVCCDCNEIKNTKESAGVLEEVTKGSKVYKMYPRSSNSFLVVHPHFDNYEEHIHHCGDFYVSKSVKGSYTIHVCELNRKIHKNGIDPMALTEPELFQMLNNFISEVNFTKKAILFNQIREYFIKIG